MDELNELAHRQQQTYKRAACEIYSDVLLWWRESYADAIFPEYDKAAEMACFGRAAKEWRDVTGLPPIDTANPRTWNAIMAAAGRPDKVGYLPSRETISAVLAWAQSLFAANRRISPVATVEASKGRGKNVNARMLETILHEPESMGWSAAKWAKHMQCSKGTIGETTTWKDLEMRRERDRAERMKDRHQRPKKHRTIR